MMLWDSRMPTPGRECSKILNIGFEVSPGFPRKSEGLWAFQFRCGMPVKGFQFTISWATNTSVVVFASTNLQTWTPLATNTLVNGTHAFIDSAWTNYPRRWYRVCTP